MIAIIGVVIKIPNRFTYQNPKPVLHEDRRFNVLKRSYLFYELFYH